jgi:hypothetical protein
MSFSTAGNGARQNLEFLQKILTVRLLRPIFRGIRLLRLVEFHQ